jgi:hyperosmotically inducible periplasmic protein
MVHTRVQQKGKKMREGSNKISRFLLLVGSFAFGVSLIARPVLGNQDPQQPDSYSTKTDAHPTPPASDEPKMTSSDRAIAQKIRKAIDADKSLSAYAHHIKILAQDGKVTLQGSVRSTEERSSIFRKAAAVAGHDNVTNKIDVAPSKP